jgi:AhpC/TSA family
MEPVPLPALQLTGMDGQTVKTSDLPSKGNWLLIYVNPKSHFCDEMLKQMKKDQYPDLAANAIFLVGGTVDDAKALQAKYPDLAAASWYADPNRDAFTLLKLHGVPAVIGINQQTMKWTVNGMIPDAGTFKAILNSWIEQQAAPKTS